MHGHAVTLSTCDQNHHVSLQQLSELLILVEMNATSCLGRASTPDTAAPTFTQRQTSFRQRLPPANLPASRSRRDHGGGHRQHQDQAPPSAGEARRRKSVAVETSPRSSTVDVCVCRSE